MTDKYIYKDVENMQTAEARLSRLRNPLDTCGTTTADRSCKFDKVFDKFVRVLKLTSHPRRKILTLVFRRIAKSGDQILPFDWLLRHALFKSL